MQQAKIEKGRLPLFRAHYGVCYFMMREFDLIGGELLHRVHSPVGQEEKKYGVSFNPKFHLISTANTIQPL